MDIPSNFPVIPVIEDVVEDEGETGEVRDVCEAGERGALYMGDRAEVGE